MGIGTTVRSMLKTVIATSLVVTVPLGLVRSLGGFEAIELAAYDDFMRRRPAEAVDDRISVVTISDDDIEQLQQFPIHDSTFAQALQKLERFNPRAIGLDISRDVPQGPSAGRKQLTDVISSSKTIVSGCLLSGEDSTGSPPAPGTPDGGAAFAEFPIDADTTVRRVLLVSVPGATTRPIRVKHACNDPNPENEVYSLSFELARMYLAGENINPEPTEQGEIRFGSQVLKRINPNFGSYAHADANDYQMMLNYRGASPVFREISIRDVLQNKVQPEWIRDRVILIGNISNVSKDFLATPYLKTELGLRNMHGVMVHAHAVSQILSAVLNQRPFIRSWSEPGEVLWLWVWSLGSGLLAFYNRRLGLFILGVVGLSAALWGICYGLFVTQGLWIPWVPPLIGIILTALGVRLVDLASRSGYAQALYEQIRDQMQSGGGRDRKGDYLERLVLRARAVRQQEAMAELLQDDHLSLTTASPEMQALYEQIESKVRRDLATEQAAQLSSTAQTRSSTRQASRVQGLLNRAQQLRNQPASSNSQPPETLP